MQKKHIFADCFLLPIFMPQTRLATLRYQALDRCFSDRTRYYFIEDLIEAVNRTLKNHDKTPVERRTVFYDISAMKDNRDWEVDFEEPARVDGRRYYRYADPDYSIWKNDLNEQQLAQLKSLLLLLQQFHGLPQFERVQEMVKQLEEKYEFHLPSPEHVISFGANEEAAGLEFLSPLFEAIISKQSLRITYQPYGKKAFKSIVHPYYIKQYNNRWFLWGYTTDGVHDNIVNMSFDRIKKISPSSAPYIENTFRDFDDFFDDFIGVTKTDADLQKIVLRVVPTRLPYILSKPLHPSQRNRRSSEGIIELKVIPNREMYQLLLSFGPDVEVIEPAEIRQKMEQYVQEMAEKYNKVASVQKGCTKEV